MTRLQPIPQVCDVWRYLGNDPFPGVGALARVVAVGHVDAEGWPLVCAEVEHGSDGRSTHGRRVANWVKWWRLVERDGRPWPPAQEPEPAGAIDTAYDTPTHGVEPATSGAAMIAAERRRQVDAEGWTAEHDDTHVSGELALAALCYIDRRIGSRSDSDAPAEWPWDTDSWRPVPEDRVRELVKAGAMIAAEIDRLRLLDTAQEPEPDGLTLQETVAARVEQRGRVMQASMAAAGQALAEAERDEAVARAEDAEAQIESLTEDVQSAMAMRQHWHSRAADREAPDA